MVTADHYTTAGLSVGSRSLVYTIRYDRRVLTWTRKLSIQLNLAHVARN